MRKVLVLLFFAALGLTSKSWGQVATNTPTNTATNTPLATRTPTNTPTSTPTFTSTNTTTATFTNTPTFTPTATFTNTPTFTPAPYRPGPASENTLYNGLLTASGTPYLSNGVSVLNYQATPTGGYASQGFFDGILFPSYCAATDTGGGSASTVISDFQTNGSVTCYVTGFDISDYANAANQSFFIYRATAAPTSPSTPATLTNCQSDPGDTASTAIVRNWANATAVTMNGTLTILDARAYTLGQTAVPTNQIHMGPSIIQGEKIWVVPPGQFLLCVANPTANLHYVFKWSWREQKQ